MVQRESLYDDQLVDKAVNGCVKETCYDRRCRWLNSSAFDDEKDRVLIKQTGEKTYFCSDIAYHKNKN